MSGHLRLLLLVTLPVATAAAQDHQMSAPDVMYHHPRWSPDERLILAVGRDSAGTHLVIFPLAGGQPSIIRLGDMPVMAADWTFAGGIKFLEVTHEGARRNYLMDRSGRSRRETPWDSVTSATSDSSTLLFEVVKAGWSSIYAMDGRRTSARQLTSGVWAEQATFSPDGRKILFERRFEPDRMERSDLVLMSPSGGDVEVIAAGTDPSWSPDGKLVLFKAMDERGGLWVSLVDPVTRRTRRLARGVHPQWSPSGRSIVYMVDGADHQSDIYVLSLAGGTPSCLTCGVKGRN
jgi:Tol biopolymer transport system component